jgi:hypothetical protein
LKAICIVNGSQSLIRRLLVCYLFSLQSTGASWVAPQKQAFGEQASFHFTAGYFCYPAIENWCNE